MATLAAARRLVGRGWYTLGLAILAGVATPRSHAQARGRGCTKPCKNAGDSGPLMGVEGH